jgi:hypothetical protein
VERNIERDIVIGEERWGGVRVRSLTTTIQKSIQKSAGGRSLRLSAACPCAPPCPSGAYATRLTDRSTCAATPEAPAIQKASGMEACVPRWCPEIASRMILHARKGGNK